VDRGQRPEWPVVANPFNVSRFNASTGAHCAPVPALLEYNDDTVF